MKMIEVLQLISEGKIKDQTILEIYQPIDKLCTYTFNGKFKAFYSNTRYSAELSCHFKLNDDFLNFDVKLIPPIPKEYYLRLDEDDELSYVIRSSYSVDFNYDLGSKLELCESITKFTQEEIDNDKLLKFIERHGIKEEVEEYEIH